MGTKKIGLLLGDENDWPSALEMMVRRMKPKVVWQGETHDFSVDRIRIHPFKLINKARYDVVIDRLAYWHYQPREWLKKVAFLDRVYLLNNPFTFQSMEKHTAYCAMERLGLHIPETWLIPPKQGPDTKKYQITRDRYHDEFDLKAIANEIGYPLFMKPFDGGGWRGVSRISNDHELMQAYHESGQTLMHLQKGLEDYDVFVRSLAIGPQVTSLKYDPSQPMHNRYVIDHGFLSAEKGVEARRMTKIINAFFRWDFNSCEAILKDETLWAIDFANACPDIAVTSLHYYFPWAMKSLFAWTLFVAATDRPMRITMDIKPYLDIADSDRSYEEKLAAYEQLADDYFKTEQFEAFKAEQLPYLDEAMWEMVQTQEFDHMLLETIRATFPPYEWDKFIAHFRGLMWHWVEAESKQVG